MVLARVALGSVRFPGAGDYELPDADQLAGADVAENLGGGS
jgi:hypothetical protein